MKIKSYHIYLLSAIAVTAFIFSNSVRTAQASSAQSGVLLSFVCNTLNISDPDSVWLTQYIIRKCAHMAEFSAQAFFFSLFFGAKGKKVSFFFIYVLFAGLFSACTDEAIQLFSDGRSSEVKDVFIDFSGTIIGLFASVLFRKILTHFKKGASL